MLVMNFFLNFLLMVCFANSEWNRIYESENLDQFLENELKVHFSVKMKESCDLEKKNQWFPENCLKLWNQSLLDIIHPKSEKDYKNLEKSCKQRVEDITEIGKIQFLMELLLPEGCRKALERHKKDLEYIKSRDSFNKKTLESSTGVKI